MVYESDAETMQRVCHKYPMQHWTIEFFPEFSNHLKYQKFKQLKANETKENE